MHQQRLLVKIRGFAGQMVGGSGCGVEGKGRRTMMEDLRTELRVLLWSAHWALCCGVYVGERVEKRIVSQWREEVDVFVEVREEVAC